MLALPPTLLPFLYIYAVFTGRLCYRGYSSVARAVALQAIGLGFKSPYLQCTVTEGAGYRVAKCSLTTPGRKKKLLLSRGQMTRDTASIRCASGAAANATEYGGSE